MGYCCQFATVKLFFASIGIRHGEARRLRGGGERGSFKFKAHSNLRVGVRAQGLQAEKEKCRQCGDYVQK